MAAPVARSVSDLSNTKLGIPFLHLVVSKYGFDIRGKQSRRLIYVRPTISTSFAFILIHVASLSPYPDGWFIATFFVGRSELWSHVQLSTFAILFHHAVDLPVAARGKDCASLTHRRELSARIISHHYTGSLSLKEEDLDPIKTTSKVY